MKAYHKSTQAELADTELEKPWAGRLNPQWVCTVHYTMRARCARGGAVPVTHHHDDGEWSGAAACLVHLGPALEREL